MSEQFQEYVNSRGATIDVDATRGVISGVKVLGLTSKNGRHYAPQAVQAATTLYENAKVNVNHPAGRVDAPRDYRDRIGVIRKVTFREGKGLYAEFHFNPKHELAEQLAWDAANSPENVGFSHNVLGETQRQDGKVVVTKITHVESVDLVANPATTTGLFEEKAKDKEMVPAEKVVQLEEEVKELQAKNEISQLLLKASENFTQQQRKLSEPFCEAVLKVSDLEVAKELIQAWSELLSNLEKEVTESRSNSQPRSREQSVIGIKEGSEKCSFVEAIIKK